MAVCWKMPIFQNKQLINNIIYHKIANLLLFWMASFVFPVQFCYNSLLVLKMHFQDFSFTRKRCNGFPVKGRYWCCGYQCSYICKTVFQFFEILIFSQDIWESTHYVPEINLISYGTLIKAFYLQGKTNWKESETRLCRQKTAEDSIAKINVSPNIHCTFLSLWPYWK